jgi:hypothetical protein
MPFPTSALSAGVAGVGGESDGVRDIGGLGAWRGAPIVTMVSREVKKLTRELPHNRARPPRFAKALVVASRAES